MEDKKESIFKKPWVQSVTGIAVVIVIVVLSLFLKSTTSSVSIENGNISAPIISVSPTSLGVLDEVYVKVGDTVEQGQPLAHVGAEVLISKVNGLVIEVNNNPGQLFSATQPVVKMINPNEMRLVGTIKEDAGLTKINLGDPVTFTLDAYGGKKFTGYVEEIGATSKDTSVVFSISDKRVVKEFNIKIKYDNTAYPEFKNGMSAKIKVYIK
ncbi:MAG: HlyD family efflux transporter periplasmic adaptor subunit [Candidatus Moranbacteria bacterium]|nr:HlyD family efflux transporter periplasmic adaptor subunit [Candidatus Moranbacteria bacterium]